MNLIDRYAQDGLSNSRGPDEVEALQTDVMRFLAILCLCLMVIFALVQSLPVATPPAPPQLAVPTSVIQRIRQLHHQIDSLQAQRQDLDRQIAERLTARRIAVEHAQAAQQALAEVHRRLDAANRQADRLDQTIRQQQQALHTGQAHRRKLNADIDRQQKQVDRIDRQLDTLAARHVEPKPKPVRKQPKPIDAPSPAKTSESGFALQFESTQVLTRLVQNGNVGLFAMIGDSAWRLLTTGSDYRAIRQDMPTVYYEMTAQTVPAVFTHALEKGVAAFGPDAVQWAVVLPKGIRAKIERIMTAQAAGTITIGPLGTVRLDTAKP